jgi:hypothetical protein
MALVAALWLGSAGAAVAQPHDAARTTTVEDSAIGRALALIGQPMNPVVIVDAEQARRMYGRLAGAGEPPADLNAFRAPGDPADPRIYVVRSSRVYRDALRRGNALAVLKLAATLVHERVHDTDGEAAAYRLQSDFVRSRLHMLSPAQRRHGWHYVQALDWRAAALAPDRLLALRQAAAARRSPAAEPPDARTDAVLVLK